MCFHLSFRIFFSPTLTADPLTIRLFKKITLHDGHMLPTLLESPNHRLSVIKETLPDKQTWWISESQPNPYTCATNSARLPPLGSPVNGLYSLHLIGEVFECGTFKGHFLSVIAPY